MYKRFKNRVLKKKGVEEKKKCLPRLVSSEPMIDLRCQASSTVSTVVDSGLSIDTLSPPSFVQDAVRLSTQLTTPSHSSNATRPEQGCIDTTCCSSVSCTTTYTTTTTTAADLLSARCAANGGAVCSVGSPTPSCSTSAPMNTDFTTITAESSSISSRARLHGTPATTSHHPPMLSADSGVEVDCCCLESCCSCADVDDVFTDDEGEGGELVDDDGWRIAAHDVSLDKVLNESSCETVYR